MSVRAVLVVLVGSWLASCTAHGTAPATDQEQVESDEPVGPDRFAWLAEIEAPRPDEPMLQFATAPIRCSPAEPWTTPESDRLELWLPDEMDFVYEDRPGLPGFRTALGLPVDAEPTTWSIARDERTKLLRWEVEDKLGGFERIASNREGNPTRVDGFDGAGEWRRTALFEYRPPLARRVEFEIVDGTPNRGRTSVFQHGQVSAVVGDDGVYRYWKTSRGSRTVEFVRYPDRLERTAQIYEDGVPQQRVDTFPN